MEATIREYREEQEDMGVEFVRDPSPEVLMKRVFSGPAPTRSITPKSLEQIKLAKRLKQTTPSTAVPEEEPRRRRRKKTPDAKSHVGRGADNTVGEDGDALAH